MFEEFDFDFLMDRMLANVSDNLDKREGSVIYDAIAPVALELANFYITLDIVMNEIFADSASYYYLVKRAAERGLYPNEATHAVVKMVVTPVTANVQVGDRFNLDMLNYEVTEIIDSDEGTYKLVCETEGVVGNQQTGTLLPIEYIEELETAEITEILIPGEEEENVEAFRERYFASFTDQAFGGNKNDYEKTVNAIDGVGGCKIISVWNGGISPSDMVPGDNITQWIKNQTAELLGEDIYAWLQSVYNAASQGLLTVGGKVRVIIISSNYTTPSDELIKTVKETLDPEETTGEGDGLVPIGHVVNVIGAEEVSVNVKFTITYNTGYSYDSIKDSVEGEIDTYFSSLCRKWAETENITIASGTLISLITNLNLSEILNIAEAEISIDGEDAVGFLTLDSSCIPIRGDISG